MLLADDRETVRRCFTDRAHLLAFLDFSLAVAEGDGQPGGPAELEDAPPNLRTLRQPTERKRFGGFLMGGGK